MRIKRLDLYILTEVIGPVVGGVVFFSFVFLMFQILRLADFFIIHGVAIEILLEMAGLMIVSFLPIALPIAFLIGILVAFGRLSADSELVAMKANGISVFRLAIPALAVALAFTILSLGLNMEWVPRGDRLFKSMLIRVSNTKISSSIKEGTFTTGFFDLLIYADNLDSKTNRLQNVFIFDEREPKNPLAVVAREGEIINVKTEKELASAAMLKLYSGNIHTNEIASGQYQKVDFNDYSLFLKVDEGVDTSTTKPRMIPYAELRRAIRDTQVGTQHNLEYRTELWRRWAVAISPLIFVFLGIGFGTFRTRAVRAGAALVALIVLLIYWGVQGASTVAAHKGLIPPVIAMQIPNLVMAALATYGFKTATW